MRASRSDFPHTKATLFRFLIMVITFMSNSHAQFHNTHFLVQHQTCTYYTTINLHHSLQSYSPQHPSWSTVEKKNQTLSKGTQSLTKESYEYMQNYCKAATAFRHQCLV